MYRYFPAPLSFRLSAWPYGGDHYIKTFRSSNFLRFDIRAVLEYVESELNKIPLAFVFKTTFTLTNVYSNYHRISIGLSVEPAQPVLRGPVVFTFARTRQNIAHFVVNKFWATGKSAIWGTNLNRPNDFISVSLPLERCSEWHMPGVLERDLQYLHDVMGAYSKAVIRQQPEITLTSADMIKSKYFRWNIPKVMWHLAISDWAYCLDFWRRMPELLRVTWTPMYLEYYCRFIAPNLPQLQESKFYDQYFEEAKDQITHFILRYMQGTVKPDESNLLQFLPIMEDFTDVETLATNIAKGKFE
mgnify:CR=1 FL=1